MDSLGKPPSMVCSMTLVQARFEEHVWIKARKYLVCKLPKTDREGRGKGSKGIRNPLNLSSTFFPHGCSSSSCAFRLSVKQ